MASDEREIRTVHSIWIDAVNAGDLARLLTLVAEYVVFLTPGQAPFGREEFSSNFMAAHQQMRICCTSELEEVIVVGEIAYTRSRDALSVTPRAGGKAAPARRASHDGISQAARRSLASVSRYPHFFCRGLTPRWSQRRLLLEFMDDFGFTVIFELREPAAGRRGSALDR
jgi:uncharacterized protein (TIGR02246 family)